MTMIVLAIDYEVEDCIHCGFQFAMPAEFVGRRRNDHKTFYCPACRKPMCYLHETKLEKVEAKLRRKAECCDFYTKRTATLVGEVEHERRRAASYRGLATKRQKALVAAKGENDA